MFVFGGELQEVPEILMSKVRQLKPGLLIHILLEDYTEILESVLPDIQIYPNEHCSLSDKEDTVISIFLV